MTTSRKTTMSNENTPTGTRLRSLVVCGILAAGGVAFASAISAGCSKKSGGTFVTNTGNTGTPTASPHLDQSQALPGAIISATTVSGASGQNGAFQVGDRLALRFTLTRSDGSGLPLSELDGSEVFLSGPTFNYQRVFAWESTAPLTSATPNGDGSYTYTFPPIPARYVAPPNYSGKFTAGVLSGQPVLSGTYTWGIDAFKTYTRGSVTVKDVANLTGDVLFGTETTITHREEVTQQSCEQCHEHLQMPAGHDERRSVTGCLLCHVAGSEDWNEDDATLRPAGNASSPPSATVEFKVMIHRIHNGGSLPSVLGIGGVVGGNPTYTQAPLRDVLIGDDRTLHDYSGVTFPVFLDTTFPMPKRVGYSSLSGTGVNGSSFQANDDTFREGIVQCDKCHGTPSGDPVGFASDASTRAIAYKAPAQGNLAFGQPSRRACGSCHDDVDWTLPYTSNNLTMPPQPDDSQCITCHVNTNNSVDTVIGHLHPMLDDAIMPPGIQGISFVCSGATPSTGLTLTPGGKLALQLSFLTDAGQNVAIASVVSSLSCVISGPTTNYNLVLYTSIPTAVFGTNPQTTYTINAPEPVFLEDIGNATNATLAPVLSATSLSPHWVQYAPLQSPTYVHLGTVSATVSQTLASAVNPMQNWIDVPHPTVFARQSYICVDRGNAGEEYLRVQYVQVGVNGSPNDRLFFTSPNSFTSVAGSFGSLYGPWIRNAHAAGAPVALVTVKLLTAGTDYSLDAATGTVTELSNANMTIGSPVLVSYTGDWQLPALYPPALDDTPDVNDSVGKWAGKSIVDGTYTVGVWGAYSWNYVLNGETNAYKILSNSENQSFLVGSATTITPYPFVTSGQNCMACHNDVWFHGGGRKNFDTCILCHGTAGSQAIPSYTAANQTGPPGVLVNFRNMLHKIHMGSSLTFASTYEVIGYGSAPYPNNFGADTFGDIIFPVTPNGVRECDKCHGLPDRTLPVQVWDVPSDRSHPTEQVNPMDRYKVACLSCHDSNDASAHDQLMSSPAGQESCLTCHGMPGATYFTGVVHLNQDQTKH
jgi:hypothetical protein